MAEAQASSVGSGVISGLFGIANTAISNAWADSRTAKDRKMNYRYNELAAQNADARTRALYNDFYSPQALANNYIEAGLSPSLMFGGTPGQGGAQGAQGAGPAGPQTPFMPFSLVEAAQAAALMAQAKKTEAETNTIEGNNQRGLAEIADTLANAGFKQASTRLTSLQSDWQEVENLYQRDFKDLDLEQLAETVEMTEWQAKSAKWQAKKDKISYQWDKEIYDNGVNPMLESTKNMIADTLLKGAQKELTEKQRQEVSQHIQYMIDDIFIRKMHLNNETFMLDFDRNLKEAQTEYYKRSKEIMGTVTDEDQFNKWMDLGARIITTAAQIASLFFLKGKLPVVTPPANYNGHRGMNADGWIQ